MTRQQTTARAIYEALLQSGPMTASDLVRVTQRTRETALAVVQRLLKAQVIKRVGVVRKKARGRPAHLLAINPAIEPRDIPR